MTGAGRSLAAALFAHGDRRLPEVARDRALLRRRLLLAELLASPPALRQPEERSPLSPRGED